MVLYVYRLHVRVQSIQCGESREAWVKITSGQKGKALLISRARGRPACAPSPDLAGRKAVCIPVDNNTAKRRRCRRRACQERTKRKRQTATHGFCTNCTSRTSSGCAWLVLRPNVATFSGPGPDRNLKNWGYEYPHSVQKTDMLNFWTLRVELLDLHVHRPRTGLLCWFAIMCVTLV